MSVVAVKRESERPGVRPLDLAICGDCGREVHGRPTFKNRTSSTNWTARQDLVEVRNRVKDQVKRIAEGQLIEMQLFN